MPKQRKCGKTQALKVKQNEDRFLNNTFGGITLLIELYCLFCCLVRPLDFYSYAYKKTS